MSDVRIKAPVIIREVLDARTYRAALPNGKAIFAFAGKTDSIPPLKAGDHFHVLLSLCDFDTGRLVPENVDTICMEHPVIDGCDTSRVCAAARSPHRHA